MMMTMILTSWNLCALEDAARHASAALRSSPWNMHHRA